MMVGLVLLHSDADSGEGEVRIPFSKLNYHSLSQHSSSSCASFTACLSLTDIMCVLTAHHHGYSLINKHVSVFNVVHLGDKRILSFCNSKILSVCFKECSV